MSGVEILLFVLAMAATGALSGLLAGVFGVGGGAVVVPVLYSVLGVLDVDPAVRMHVAVGSSLAIIVPTSLRSFTAHRARGAVDETYLRSVAAPLLLGVIGATLMASRISSGGLRAVFAALAFAMALKMLFNRPSWRLGPDIPAQPWRGVTGAAIGFLSTLMGIGGGVLNNTFMTLYSRPIHQAVATSSGVGTLISVPGMIGYVWAGWNAPGLPIFSTGYINWLAVAAIMPVSLLFAPAGVRIAHALNKRHLEIAFGLFMVIVAARFGWSLI